MYLARNMAHRFFPEYRRMSMFLSLCATYIVILAMITGCGFTVERDSNTDETTVHYVSGDKGQVTARTICYRMLKDTLTPLPKSAHWGVIHPLDPDHDRLTGGKIFYDNNNLNPNAPVTIIGTYWLIIDPPQNSGKYLTTIFHYWQEHGWKISYDSAHQPTGASPPYAQDYVINTYISMHNSISVGYSSGPFLREHGDGKGQPDIIEHP